jgi:hypothetical protein
MSTPNIRITTHESATRSAALFAYSEARRFRIVDRMFMALMPVQWALAIVISLRIASGVGQVPGPRAHASLLLALLGGGLLSAGPLLSALRHPGARRTRNTFAAAQMLMSGLLCCLPGGGAACQAHLFVSLALLSMYRDGQTLALGALFAVVELAARGLHLGQIGWAAFEAGFLAIVNAWSCREARSIWERVARAEAPTPESRILKPEPTGDARAA